MPLLGLLTLVANLPPRAFWGPAWQFFSACLTCHPHATLLLLVRGKHLEVSPHRDRWSRIQLQCLTLMISVPLDICLFCPSGAVVVTLSVGCCEDSIKHVVRVQVVGKGVTALRIISYRCLLHSSRVSAIHLFPCMLQRLKSLLIEIELPLSFWVLEGNLSLWDYKKKILRSF